MFWVNPCVFPLSGLPWSLLILLSYCLTIRVFRLCFFFVATFLSKIIRFLLHSIVGIFSCHLLPLVGRIFSRYFQISCFVRIALPLVGISLLFLLSPVLSHLFPQVVLLFFSFVAFSVLSVHVPAYFLCFVIFSCFRSFFFFYLHLHLNSPTSFWFCLRAFWGDPNFLTN